MTPLAKKLILSICVLAGSAPLFAQAYLAPLPSGYGPFDYSDDETRNDKVGVVEKYHFNENVRTLQRGMNGSVWADLTYTLRAFPNHHPALEAMGRLQRMKDDRMSVDLRDHRYRGMPPDVTAEAYFERAIEFAPHDAVAKLLYGIHLHTLGKVKPALKQYLAAEKLELKSADLEYNLGLAYTDLKQFNKALPHAQRAYKYGHPLAGLRKRLQKAGVWQAAKPTGKSKKTKDSEKTETAAEKQNATSKATTDTQASQTNKSQEPAI